VGENVITSPEWLIIFQQLVIEVNKYTVLLMGLKKAWYFLILNGKAKIWSTQKAKNNWDYYFENIPTPHLHVWIFMRTRVCQALQGVDTTKPDCFTHLSPLFVANGLGVQHTDCEEKKRLGYTKADNFFKCQKTFDTLNSDL